MILTTTNAKLGTKVRRETWEGREYIVAPFVSMREGVMAGSRGPLMYPAQEIAANPGVWNGVPLVGPGHPKDEDGTALSAQDPEVRDRWQIGTVWNDEITPDSERAGEAWFDCQLTAQRAPEVYRALTNALAGRRGGRIELSTGLYTTDVETENTRVDSRTGRAYNMVATEYRPDHLAILTRGQIGACSVDDGCGVALNKTAPAGNCGCTPAAPARGGVDNAVVPAQRIIVPSARPSGFVPSLHASLGAPPLPVYGPDVSGLPLIGQQYVANSEEDILPLMPLVNALGEADWRGGKRSDRGRYGAHPGYETGGHSFDDTGRGTLRPGSARRVIAEDDEALVSPPLVEDRRVNGHPPETDPRFVDSREANDILCEENLRRLGVTRSSGGADVLNADDADLLMPPRCLPRARR